VRGWTLVRHADATERAGNSTNVDAAVAPQLREQAPACPPRPDAWLVAVTATVVCVAWLGALEFALRTESLRADANRHATALPGPAATGTHRDQTALPISGLLLAGVLVGLAVLESRPPRTVAGDPAE
jgi:hypothetical protein